MPTLLAAARLVQEAALVAAFGTSLFHAVVLPAGDPDWRRLRAAVAPALAKAVDCAFIVALCAMPIWLAAQASYIADEGIWPALADGTVAKLVTATRFGHATALRCLVLLLGTVLFLRAGSRASPAARALVAGVLLGSFSVTSHAAGLDGWSGAVVLAADALHALAAGAWIGALAPFGYLVLRLRGLARGPRLIAGLSRGFSPLGVGCVGVLVISGIVNAWDLVGGLPGLLGTTYGKLLLIKVALFAGMVGLAARNRFVLTERLARGDGSAATGLAVNAALETGLGLAVLACAILLTSLEPGAHQTPVWPLPWRLDEEAAASLATPIVAMVAGVVLILGTMRSPDWRALGATVGICISVPFVPVLPQIIVPAYPTSYTATPLAYTMTNVAAGMTVYEQHCRSCHGWRGRGDGPAAASVRPLPANLIAHATAHLDGELYWWIARGIAPSMPAFGTALDDQQIWSIIAFIHADVDTASLRGEVNAMSANGYPMPEFGVNCPGSNAQDGRRGNAMHIVVRAQPDARAKVAEEDRRNGILTIFGNGEASGAFCELSASHQPVIDWLFAPDAANARYDAYIDAGDLLRGVFWPAADAVDPLTARQLESLRRPALRSPAPNPHLGHSH